MTDTNAQATTNGRAPRFLRREPPAPPALPPDASKIPHHLRPDVERFLNSVSETGERLENMKAELEHVHLDNDKLTGRVSLLEGELRRCQRTRDEYQAGYCELKAQLAVLVTSATAACQAVIETANSAMGVCREQMIRAGVDPIDARPEARSNDAAPLTVSEEATVKKLATMFAPEQQHDEMPQPPRRSAKQVREES